VNAHTDTKRTVLRGVYEDNLGIPRSSTGKGRSRFAPEPQPAREPSGRQGRLFLIALLGLVVLLGINFRMIVSLDGLGPVAMQINGKQTRRPAAALGPAQTGGGANTVPDPDLLNDTEIMQLVESSGGTTEQYDTMLSHLGMPMADLFGLKVQTIVIDPGHGGIDPGATGHQGLREKDVVLDIARRLRDKLAQDGNYRVLLTRERDTKVYLKQRVAFARENHADLFISLHINSLPVAAGPVNYVETYYFGPHQDQRSLELAEKENRDSDYVLGDFRKIIARIGDTLKTEESEQLAGSIHRHLYDSLKQYSSGLMDAGAKTGPFVVLLGVDVPSVLVEISCISNKAEETRLSTSGYRDSVAGFLKAGIVGYLERRTQRINTEGGNLANVVTQER
jgi:N-acetylmuramoyl-L-alanine amidase